MKKILIVIGDAGAGHMSCANATKKAILKIDSSIIVEIVDLFQFSPFTKLYNFVQYLVSGSKIAEAFFNTSFLLINKSKLFSNLAYFFTLNSIYKPTLELLRKSKPDLVISNNALTSEVLTRCKREFDFKYVITVPDLVTVVRWWASPNANSIFSPTQEASKGILSFCHECSVVTGYYPLREIPNFSKEEISFARKEFCEQNSFDPNKEIILITGCGVSTAGLVRKLKYFINNSKYQLIILTGKDIRLKKKFEKKFKDNARICIIGFTNDILKLFSISDLIISKTGPATILEIERLNKKAIFTEPPVIQEFGNVEYLKKNSNFTYIGNEYSNIAEVVEEQLKKEVIPYESEIQDADALAEYILKV